jgi:thioesterase domain-containing protein
VGEIRAAQPEGPYLIGGYCFSGLVAYEMARKLSTEGQELGIVALIDSYFHGSSRRAGRLEMERVKMREFMQSGIRGKAGWLRRRTGGLRARLSEAFYLRSGDLAYRLLALRDPEKALPRVPWRMVLIASGRARQTYAPPPSNIAIDFFRAQRSADQSHTPWEGIAGEVRLRQVIVPGIDHTSMMQEPDVQILADEIRRTLAELSGSEASIPAPPVAHSDDERVEDADAGRDTPALVR